MDNMSTGLLNDYSLIRTSRRKLLWTLGAAAMSGRAEKNAADASRKKFQRRRWSAGRDRRGVKLNIGLAGEESVAVMLLDALCSLRDKFGDSLNTFGVEEMGWRRKKVQCDTKDVQRY